MGVVEDGQSRHLGLAQNQKALSPTIRRILANQKSWYEKNIVGIEGGKIKTLGSVVVTFHF
jgi:hypothetical protein